jgi:hypothetical protein
LYWLTAHEDLHDDHRVVHAGSTVPTHTRRKPRSDFADDSCDAPFFDASKVPAQIIEVPNPEAQGLLPDQCSSGLGQSTRRRSESSGALDGGQSEFGRTTPLPPVVCRHAGDSTAWFKGQARERP